MANNQKSIQVVATSSFKDSAESEKFYSVWVHELERLNGCRYERIDIRTSLGKTVIWSINQDRKDLKTLVIFPGFRTSSLFWDIDHGLSEIKKHCRIFLVETNGQPTLSDGNSSAIKSDGYGRWAAEVLTELHITKAIVAGASFGGLVCLKLALVAPELIDKVVLLNPGCLQPFSLTWKNLYYNLLPLIRCSRQNVIRFLDNAVFYGKDHHPSAAGMNLVVDFELFAITRYRDKTQKPYAMSDEDLRNIESEVYLILGDQDILFPYQKSKSRAESLLPHLKQVIITKNTGHGIEVRSKGLDHLLDILKL